MILRGIVHYHRSDHTFLPSAPAYKNCLDELDVRPGRRMLSGREVPESRFIDGNSRGCRGMGELAPSR